MRHRGESRSREDEYSEQYRRSSRFAGWHADVTPAINVFYQPGCRESEVIEGIPFVSTPVFPSARRTAGYERFLHRITLTGDDPVGPDGYRSEALIGDPVGVED